jgi:hypothetical protein
LKVKDGLFAVLFVFPFQIKCQPQTDKIIYQQNTVRDSKNPVADQIALNREPDRRENLPDKKPTRNAFARAFLVLFVNLLD